jgi:hypothetical protein
MAEIGVALAKSLLSLSSLTSSLYHLWCLCWKVERRVDSQAAEGGAYAAGRSYIYQELWGDVRAEVRSDVKRRLHQGAVDRHGS